MDLWKVYISITQDLQTSLNNFENNPIKNSQKEFEEEF